MAEDKSQRTEKPTPKRKREARRDGKTARSHELSLWVLVLVASFLTPWLFGNAEKNVLAVTSSAMHVAGNPTTQGAQAVLDQALKAVLTVVLPIGGVMSAVAIFVNVLQVGRAFSLKAISPQFSRISPKAGLRRVFSPGGALQLAEQLAKLSLLSLIAYATLSSVVRSVALSRPIGLSPIANLVASSALTYTREIAMFGVVVGVIDFAYHRHKLNENLKMTRQEVKDEARAAEGDPKVKGEIRKRSYQIARSRMMASVRTADLVVTNPTHFAVAMTYERGSGAAPTVVAKGAGEFALRLREEAMSNGVPCVEDPPLARWMYSFCEIERPIPAEIYHAVAKVLAFVYSLPPLLRSSRLLPVAPSQVPVDPGEEAGVAFARRYRAEQARQQEPELRSA